jgi:hypothetical protein
MWETFANYEGGEPNQQLQRAKAHANVTFSEALKFWHVQREVALRIEVPLVVVFTLIYCYVEEHAIMEDFMFFPD